MRLAISGEHLAAYLTHVAEGAAFREVSRRTDVQASTILRRVRRVEDLRDCPEWDELLNLLEAAHMARPDPQCVTVPDLLSALDLQADTVRAAVRAALVPMKTPGARIVTNTDAPRCVVTFGDMTQPAVPIFARRVLLAALALGWVRRDESHRRRVRAYVLTDLAAACFGLDVRPPPAAIGPGLPMWVAAQARRNPDLMTAGRVGLLQAVHATFIAGPSPVSDLKSQLPASLFDILAMVCRDGLGVEAIERHMGWPVRSGKVALALALDAAELALAGRVAA